MTRIDRIIAKEIFDSRGNPTLEVMVISTNGKSGSFAVPSGASTGTHEAFELRDGDKNYYGGKGVFKAIKNVNEILAESLHGKDVLHQRSIDEQIISLDGTRNKSKIGGNAAIGVSVAVAKCAATVSGIEVYEYLQTLAEIKPSRAVPYLYMNLINGGMHAKTQLAFQEYHIVPDSQSAEESFNIGISIQLKLNELISQSTSRPVTIGDEGGVALDVLSVRSPLELLSEATKVCGYADRVRFALDVAASSFFDGEKYLVGGSKISAEELTLIYRGLIKEFGLLSIEDPYFEEDFQSFANLHTANPDMKVLGDDLTVTNKILLKRAIDEKSINAMIIKPNQIGTLTETLDTMKLARDNNVDCVVSHRSGETNDDFIADLAYAFGCFGLKSGAPQKAERAIKYKRLIEISKSK